MQPASAATSSVDGASSPDASQLQRAHALIATARDLISSLSRLTAQLEQEVGSALDGLGRPVPTTAGRREIDVTSVEQENAQLRAAIEGRAVIEQAKGMVMAAHGCDADRAFGLLTEVSRREQRKVREVAAEIVDARSREPFRRTPRRIDLRSGETAAASGQA